MLRFGQNLAQLSDIGVVRKNRDCLYILTPAKGSGTSGMERVLAVALHIVRLLSRTRLRVHLPRHTDYRVEIGLSVLGWKLSHMNKATVIN